MKKDDARLIDEMLGLMKANEETSPLSDVQEKVISFLQENPNPPDDKVHAWADKQAIETDELEAVFYSIATKFATLLNEGKAKEAGFTEEDADPDELAKGIGVESEHTSCVLVATKIALDHLSEMPDYYTKLAAMEGK